MAFGIIYLAVGSSTKEMELSEIVEDSQKKIQKYKMYNIRSII